jgi:TonB family protein
MESEANLLAAAESPSDTPPAQRLVIRVVIPRGSLQAPERRRFSKGALLLILVPLAVLLSWVGLSVFRTDRTSASAVSESSRNAESPSSARVPAHPTAVVSAETLPKRAAATAETISPEIEPRSSKAKQVESEVRKQTDAPPAPINEVIPDVPRSALDTIRGTVRVSVRVIIDQEGAVIAASADDPGPSRYFERLSVEASKKWTFTPANSEAQRILLLKFHFTRAGATARAD